MTALADSLLHKIDRSNLPAHVAIIMDGNGRWAKKRGLPRLLGHRQGTKTVREIVEAASEVGVKVLTLYSFSTENWSRPKTEISGLMRILRDTLRKEEAHLHKNNVRLNFIGDLSQLPKEVQSQLEASRETLSNNTGLNLILALNYGGRQEILKAVNQLVSEGHTVITGDTLASRLFTSKVPDPDLVIRTSGEFRVSNFLLWQIAYSEFHVTSVLWPDFKRAHFFQAILDFQSRDRRFGGVT